MVKLERTDLGNFAKCLVQIYSRKQKIATAKQAMQERIRQGKNADICQNGFWLPENYSSVKGDILVALHDYNPIIPYAQDATDAHRKGNEFYLTDKVLLQGKPTTQVLREIAEEDAKKPVYKRRVLISEDKKERTDISTKTLGEQEEIIFLARGEKLAKQYGEFLNGSGIKETSIYRSPIIVGKDLTRGLWLCRLVVGGRSDFYGDDRGLCSSDGSLLGVCESAEGTSQKVLPYTKREVDRNLRILDRLKQGKVRVSDLESEVDKVVKFLERLKQ